MSTNKPRKPRPAAVAKAVTRKTEKRTEADRSIGRYYWNLVCVEVVFSFTDDPTHQVGILKVQFPEKTDFKTLPSRRIQGLMNTGAMKVMSGFPQDRHAFFKAQEATIMGLIPLGLMTDDEFWAGHPDRAQPVQEAAAPDPVLDAVTSAPTTPLAASLGVAVGATPAGDNVLPFKAAEPAAE